jgi:hypothetical protein
MQTPSWSTSEEQSLPAGPPPNAPPLSSDEPSLSSAQEPENTDYHRGSSAGDIKLSGGKSDTFRDADHKQVKVLSFSLHISLSSCAPRYSFFAWPSLYLSVSSTTLCSILSSA